MHVIPWLTELRVARLIVENVVEIMDWDPVNLKTGRPIDSRKGEYVRSWVSVIEGLGFHVDFRILNRADFGDPTTRQRFFLIGRSDKRRLRWPVPTHSADGVGDLFGAGAKKWRAAREIIGTRRDPRRQATLRAEGERGHATTETYILNRHGENGSVRAHPIDEPMPTADCRGSGYLVEGRVEPFIAVVAHGNDRIGDDARRVRDIGDRSGSYCFSKFGNQGGTVASGGAKSYSPLECRGAGCAG